MLYLLQITVYSGLMYSIYLLLLRNRMDHNLSRLYLLLCAILPLLLPFVKIPGAGFGGVGRSVEVVLPAVNISGEANSIVNANYFISIFLMVVYVAASVLLLVILIAGYMKMLSFIKSHRVEEYKGIKLLRNTDIGPGSWGNYVFIPENEMVDAVFEHELAHIKLKHSLDIACVQMLQCIFWPNIVLIAIIKELRMVHEFQADAFAADNKDEYPEILLAQIFNVKQFSLSHTFFHHPIKRRIMILNRSRNTSTGLAGVATFFIAFCLIGTIVMAQSVKSQTSHPTSATGAVATEKINALDKAEKMPQFNGSIADFMAQHIKYPKDAKEKGIEGKVMVKFVVDQNGNVVQPEIMRSPDDRLSAAALSVINQMPKWTPGEQDGKPVAVYYYIPIMFKL
jgi:TonB family protein